MRVNDLPIVMPLFVLARVVTAIKNTPPLVQLAQHQEIVNAGNPTG
jgi:hypothetical protein